MTNINLVGVTWSGFPGGPGRSTFAFAAGTFAATDLHDFYGVMLGVIPSSVVLNVDTAGPQVEDTTGALTGGWTATSTSQMTGSNGAEYASGVGAVVRWDTGVVADGRVIRGHTFIVPTYGGLFDTNGSIDDSNKAIISGAAMSLVTSYAGSFLCWHRPKKNKTTHAIERNGSSHVVTSGYCVDRPAVLRSRRN